jgi:hypothetical protein
MEKMKALIDEMKQVQENMQKKVHKAAQEAVRAEEQRKQAEHTYRKMLSDDASGKKSYSSEELSAAKRKVDGYATDAVVAQDRARTIQELQKDNKMPDMLGRVKVAWKQEKEILNAEIAKCFEEAREHHAKLTIAVQKGNQFYKRGHELRYLFNSAELIVGIRNVTTDAGIKETVPLHTNDGFGRGYVDVPIDGILPGERELENAYRTGQLPRWIEHYADTGELVTADEIIKRNQQAAGQSAEDTSPGSTTSRYEQPIPVHTKRPTTINDYESRSEQM